MRSEAEIREKLARLQRRHDYAVEHHHFVTVTSTTAALALARWILEEKDIPVPEEDRATGLCFVTFYDRGIAHIPCTPEVERAAVK